MTGLLTREVVSKVSKEREQFRRRLGASLAREIEAHGASVAGLAEATKIPASRIERILRGEVEAIAFEVPLPAEALGARPEDLAKGWDG
jgi:hypothetical protein